MFLIRNLSAAQARALSMLVELEAAWENLRVDPSIVRESPATVKELHQKQKAYEIFRGKLVAYNKDFQPAHVPELLLNSADRLGAWCRRMADLHQAVQHDAQGSYPAHLIEKAYRWADGLADKRKLERIGRPALSRDPKAAILELENLAQWCESLCPSQLAG